MLNEKDIVPMPLEDYNEVFECLRFALNFGDLPRVIQKRINDVLEKVFKEQRKEIEG